MRNYKTAMSIATSFLMLGVNVAYANDYSCGAPIHIESSQAPISKVSMLYNPGASTHLSYLVNGNQVRTITWDNQGHTYKSIKAFEYFRFDLRLSGVYLVDDGSKKRPVQLSEEIVEQGNIRNYFMSTIDDRGKKQDGNRFHTTMGKPSHATSGPAFTLLWPGSRHLSGIAIPNLGQQIGGEYEVDSITFCDNPKVRYQSNKAECSATAKLFLSIYPLPVQKPDGNAVIDGYTLMRDGAYREIFAAIRKNRGKFELVEMVMNSNGHLGQTKTVELFDVSNAMDAPAMRADSQGNVYVEWNDGSLKKITLGSELNPKITTVMSKDVVTQKTAGGVRPGINPRVLTSSVGTWGQTAFGVEIDDPLNGIFFNGIYLNDSSGSASFMLHPFSLLKSSSASALGAGLINVDVLPIGPSQNLVVSVVKERNTGAYTIYGNFCSK